MTAYSTTCDGDHNTSQADVVNSLDSVHDDPLLSHAMAQLAQRHQKGASLTSTQATQAYLRLLLADSLNEVFGCIFLNAQHAIIHQCQLFQGTIDSTAIYPRVVAQHCLMHNAAAVIFYHNHPSGDCTPSQADKTITRRLINALALLDIRVLDHMIVSASNASSFAQLGLL